MSAEASYRLLEVWRAAVDLTVMCFEITGRFPSRETFGLSSQLRRAAASIPSNVAEGYCRRSRAAYVHHVSIALGSHAEVETLLEISRRLSYLADTEFERASELATRVGQMLSALHRSLAPRKSRAPSPERPP